MVEAQCERVRMLYRDCARPPPPPLQTDRRQVGGSNFLLHLFFSQVKAHIKDVTSHVTYLCCYFWTIDNIYDCRRKNLVLLSKKVLLQL